MVVKMVVIGKDEGTPEIVLPLDTLVEIVLSKGGADVLIEGSSPAEVVMAVLSEGGADVLVEGSSLVEIMAVLSEGGADVLIEEKGCVR